MWAAKGHRGVALSALGRTEEAVEALTEALATSITTGSVTVRPAILTSLADAIGKAGRPMDGLRQLDDAGRRIEATQERWRQSDMHRVRGELLSVIGDLEAAEQSFHQAIAVARQQSANLSRREAAEAQQCQHDRRQLHLAHLATNCIGSTS
jgi:hypothetical protein